MRLIDADMAYEMVARQRSGKYLEMYGLRAGLDKTPTIVEARPLVRAKWETKSCVKGKQYDPTTDYWAYAHRCTNCERVSYFPDDVPDAFCRRCGAKMDIGQMEGLA